MGNPESARLQLVPAPEPTEPPEVKHEQGPPLERRRGIVLETIVKAAEALRQNDYSIPDDFEENAREALRQTGHDIRINLTRGIYARLVESKDQIRLVIAFEGDLDDPTNPHRRKITKILKEAGVHLRQEIE